MLSFAPEENPTNTIEKGKASSKNRLLWLETKSKTGSQFLVKATEWFSACYQLAWSALKAGSVGDPSHTRTASQDHFLGCLSFSDHVQVWSGWNCLRLALSVCRTKESFWIWFSGGCSLSLILVHCQLGSEWMKNITGYVNHKLLLLLILDFWSLCRCSAIVVHVCFVFCDWVWISFLLVCFVLLKSSVETPSHEHFVTHIAFLYCTRVGDHVPSVEEMSESHWLYFRWHCAFLDATLTWCLAFFISVTLGVCSFSVLWHAAAASFLRVL